MHFYFLLTRPLTVGVRAILLNRETIKIYLVRHTYTGGWYVPGGGIEVGESAEQALNRECSEETGFRPKTFTMLSLEHNIKASSRDHVVYFLIDDWDLVEEFKTNSREILEGKWFEIKNLPDDLAPETIRSLELISDSIPID